MRKAEEKIGEVAARGGAGEREMPARILLRPHLDGLRPGRAAECECMAAACAPDALRGKSVGLTVGMGVLTVAQSSQPTREDQPRRSPIGRRLIVAGDARVARHVLPVREIWRRLTGLPRVLVAGAQRKDLRKAARPVHRRVKVGDIGRIFEVEDVGGRSSGALILKRAEDRAAGAQGLIEP